MLNSCSDQQDLFLQSNSSTPATSKARVHFVAEDLGVPPLSLETNDSRSDPEDRDCPQKKRKVSFEAPCESDEDEDVVESSQACLACRLMVSHS